MIFAMTGATSMLGIATIKECIKRNHSVFAFVRPHSKKLLCIPKSPLVKIVECDLCEMQDFSLPEVRADVFIHFGWSDTDKVGRNDCSKQLENVKFAMDAVHLAQKLGCKKFIGAGSQAEYGTPNVRLLSSTPADPVIPYGIAKYSAGKFSRVECNILGMEHIWVRILSVYGPNDNPGTLVNSLILNAMNDLPMKLSACGQTWDYLYEDDAGAAFVAIAEKGETGSVYNLGSGKERLLKEFVLELLDVVNPKYKPEFGGIPYSSTQPMILETDISKLIKDTGWEPKIEFNVGIKNISLDLKNR